jgi:hypothetical protein
MMIVLVRLCVGEFEKVEREDVKKNKVNVSPYGLSLYIYTPSQLPHPLGGGNTSCELFR